MKNLYVRFEPRPGIQGKPAFAVISTTHGDELGGVAWYPRWRQFIFVPYADTIWSEDCLAAVREKVLAMTAAAKSREASRG
jgi:hypothetical protein